MDDTGCGKKDGFLKKGGTATGWALVKLQGEKSTTLVTKTSSNQQADYSAQTTGSHT